MDELRKDLDDPREYSPALERRLAGSGAEIVQLPPVYGRTPPPLLVAIRPCHLDLGRARCRGYFGYSFLNRPLIGLDPFGEELTDSRGQLTEQARSTLQHELRHFVQAVLEGFEPTVPERGGPPRAARTKMKLEGRPFLGVVSSPLSRDEYNSSGASSGVIVKLLDDESPAARSGLRAGDVIVSYAGRTPVNHAQLVGITSELRAGQTVPVIVRRAGSTVSLAVTLGTRPPDPEYEYVLKDVEFQTLLGSMIDEMRPHVASGRMSVREAIKHLEGNPLMGVWKAFAPRKYKNALSTIYVELTREAARR